MLGVERSLIPVLSPIVPVITKDKMQLYRTNKVQSVQCVHAAITSTHMFTICNLHVEHAGFVHVGCKPASAWPRPCTSLPASLSLRCRCQQSYDLML